MSDPFLRNIFVEALDQPNAEARAQFLDRACGSNSALRQQIELLLQAHDNAGAFLAEPDKRFAPFQPANALPTEAPGDLIGRYKLLQQIGEGGCGVVYMAEQEEPVRRRVALKVIKLGMDTKQVIARFEAERQALALMDHPNIARVLDAGATETGRPYFVMELIRGTRITGFCDENKLSTEERLKLFIQVCQAIQHAHQKGVIHRDIKPSNILVTVNDGVALPKVIDFGIAKATAGRLTDHTLFTAFEQFIGTPAYMSPEQAVMATLDIDTRSDIYSLGVLLYELLTGRPPFDQKELLAVGLDEMRRTIREVEPVKPSTRLTQEFAKVGKWESEKVGEDARPQSESHSPTFPPAHFQHRPLHDARELQRLISTMRGDLDWIVMKCLEKDRSRRYETANGLATDIERYLNSEPVMARPPSRWYSLQKLARRNRAALIAAACVLLALLLAVVVLTVSNVRIRHEQAQREMALFTSLKSQAAARLQSRQMGHRLDSLAAISEAAQIQRDAELRDAAIAALAVPDLRPGLPWQARDETAQAITFDADYKRYAWINDQGVISIHTVSDGRELRRFPSGPPLRRRGDYFLFSRDGRLLAKFEKGDRWSIWGVEDGQLVLRTPPVASPGIAFSRDSSSLAIPIEGSIIIIELPSREERKRWRIQHQPQALAFSPNDRYLAAGPMESDEKVSIFDVEKGQLVSELTVGKKFWAIAWHPSGKYLGISASTQIQFWDVSAAAQVSAFEAHAQRVITLSFDPSGQWLISDSWDGTPRLWQPSPAREWMRFFSGLNDLRFSKDGRFAGVIYSGADQAQLLEFIPSQVYHTFVGSLSDNQNSFSWVDISPDGRLLALASKEVSIRELPNGRELATLPTHSRWLKFHPNGKELIVSGFEKGLDIWPIGRDVAPNRVRLGPPRRVALPLAPCEIALAGDGRTIAVSVPDSAEARIADLYTGTARDLKFPHAMTDSVALSSDARWLGTGGWHSPYARLWNARTGERLFNMVGERARVTFSPDEREFVVSTSQAYVFYDVVTQKVTRRFEREGNMHLGWIAWAPDGKLMALDLSPGVIRLCEAKTGRTIAHLQDPGGNMNRWFGFTADGTQLIVAASYERAIHRWDLRAMRVELKAMGLDWDWPEFPPQTEEAKNPPALELEILSGPSAED